MSPCKKCDARCCKYFALQIDTPKAKDEFENIRWYIAHKGVSIYVDKRKWFMEIKNKCAFLGDDNKCTIYDKRPLICREHSTKDCEFIAGDFEHDHVFNKVKEFDEYLDNRFKKTKR